MPLSLVDRSGRPLTQILPSATLTAGRAVQQPLQPRGPAPLPPARQQNAGAAPTHMPSRPPLPQGRLVANQADDDDDDDDDILGNLDLDQAAAMAPQYPGWTGSDSVEAPARTIDCDCGRPVPERMGKNGLPYFKCFDCQKFLQTGPPCPTCHQRCGEFSSKSGANPGLWTQALTVPLFFKLSFGIVCPLVEDRPKVFQVQATRLRLFSVGR